MSETAKAMAPFEDEWGVTVVPVWTRTNGSPIYALQPKQLQCLRLTPFNAQGWRGHRRIGYGGAAGGGKSHLARVLLALCAILWPGSRSIIFRETLKVLEANHTTKFLEEVPGEYFGWNDTKKVATWHNGSRTYFGYLEKDKDKYNYHGNEYDLMIFEEATLLPYSCVDFLVNQRLRATVRGSKPFAVFPSNPGGQGHFWYKRWFVDRRFKPEENPADYAFVQARLADNEILRRRDPQYEQNLNQLAEPFRSWYRDGDFAKGAGAFFTELDRRMHMIPWFEPPKHWTLFGGLDPGYWHPAVFGLYAADEDGTVYKLDTLRMHHHSTDQQIAAVDEFLTTGKYRHMDVRRRLVAVHAGLDLFHKKGRELGYEGPTASDKWVAAGYPVIEAQVGRVHGAGNLRDYLHWDPPHHESGGQDPALYFCDTPGNQRTWDCLEVMVNDPDNIEDVLKVDADPQTGEGGDDEYDETRYAMAWLPPRAPSVALERSFKAFDPDVLAHEVEAKYRVREVRDSAHRPNHPELGGQY